MLMTVNSSIKSHLFSACLLIFLWAGLHAQEEASSSFRTLSLVGNANIGSVMPYPFSNIPEGGSADMLLRPYVGIQINQSFKKKLYFKVSAMYSNKSVGYNTPLVDQPYNGYYQQTDASGNVHEIYVEDVFINGTSNGYFKLQYLELNLSLAGKISKNASIYGGLYLAFLLKAENELTVDGTLHHGPGIPPFTTRFQRTEDYSGYINNTDFGFQLGYERKLYKKLNMNLQFSSGLHSVYQSDLDAVEFAMLNMYVAFGVSYSLGQNLFDINY